MFTRYSSQFKSLGIFVVFFVAGFYVIHRTTKGTDAQRDPAALMNNSFTLSGSTLEQLTASLAGQLRENLEVTYAKAPGTKVRPGDEGINKYIQIGSQVIKVPTKAGEIPICDMYKKIFLEFEAEGVRNGDKPVKMTIEDQCEVTAEFSMRPILVPVANILKEPVAEGVYDWDTSTAKLSFFNVEGAWPRLWVLKNVRFYSPNGDGEYSVSAAQIDPDRQRTRVLSF